MYTKVFRAIYDGTLADNWQALVTFQQLLILANDDGVVDMTIGAIHRTTGIPVEIIEAGIKVLEAPDHGSRTPDMEGRRISRLDEHREWGWFLINFRKYRQMVTREEKKEADRVRMAAQRNEGKSNKNSDVEDCSGPSQVVASSSDKSNASPVVADVAHTEAERDLKSKSAIADSSAEGADQCPHTEIIAAYHRLLPELPRIRSWDADRQKHLRTRWREDRKRQSLDWWERYFGYVRTCPLLMGQVPNREPDRASWMADLEWLVSLKNFRKVLERKYEDRNNREAAA